jgi:hypothetical protein
MESYSDALNKELSSTTLEKSFARAPRPETNNEVALVYLRCYMFFFRLFMCTMDRTLPLKLFLKSHDVLL